MTNLAFVFYRLLQMNLQNIRKEGSDEMKVH